MEKISFSVPINIWIFSYNYEMINSISKTYFYYHLYWFALKSSEGGIVGIEGPNQIIFFGLNIAKGGPSKVPLPSNADEIVGMEVTVVWEFQGRLGK